MLGSQRKRYLMDLLGREGQVVAKTVSEALGVSEDTIRRDLRELAREGRLLRVHGGALPASPALADFPSRAALSPHAKGAIGRAAAALIEAGQIVFLDGGTTSAQVARHLAPDLRATIVTHSPSVALALAAHAHVEVVLLGGRLFRHSLVALGAATIEAIGQIQADLFLMGVASVDAEGGAATGDFEEAAVKRAMSRAARRTVVLASPEKLGTSAPYRIVGPEALGALVVVEDSDAALLAPFRAAGIEIVLAAAPAA